MHIEGIILSKTPYKERDLICNLLLRSGKKTSVYFYGGRGGGKGNKGSILEVGFMLAVELGRKKRSVETEINIAKEYQLLWRADKIRENFQAFYLSCFYLEYLAKIAIEENFHEEGHEEHQGLFNVLSNGLYFLDESLGKDQFELPSHLFIFLTKLSAQLGIAPDTNHCIFCDNAFKQDELCLFDPQNGGFACTECCSKRDEFLSDNKNLLQEYQSSQNFRMMLKVVHSRPYKEYQSITGITHGLTAGAFNFINYQFGITADKVKSWKMVSV